MFTSKTHHFSIHCWYVSGFLAVCLLSASSRAQEMGSKQATAQALFEQARKLVKEGDFKQACPKFAESQRLDPGVGTQFNLADCYERVGRLASAYALFIEVAAATRQSGQSDREAVARERAAAIKPKLSTLAINVSEEARVEGLEVRRDGIPVGAPQWGAPIPVDPGTHEISVSAPGHEPWSDEIDVPGDAVARTLSIPVLVELPPEPKGDDAIAGGSSFNRDDYRRRREGFWSSPWNVTGVGFAVVGAVGLGASGYFTYRAVSLNDEAEELGCVDGACSNQPAQDKAQQAYDAGDLATYTLIGGGAALATASVLIFVVPALSESKTRVSVVPSPQTGATHLSVSGVF